MAATCNYALAWIATIKQAPDFFMSVSYRTLPRPDPTFLDLLRTVLKQESQTQPLSDTTPEAEAVLLQLLRRKSPFEKLNMLNQLNASLRTVMLSGLWQRHPNATDIEIRQRFAKLLLGDNLGQEFWQAYEKRLANDRRS
jgi:hypothetical protein